MNLWNRRGSYRVKNFKWIRSLWVEHRRLNAFLFHLSDQRFQEMIEIFWTKSLKRRTIFKWTILSREIPPTKMGLSTAEFAKCRGPFSNKKFLAIAGMNFVKIAWLPIWNKELSANVDITLVIGVKNNGTRGISAINKEGNNKTEKYKEVPMKEFSCYYSKNSNFQALLCFQSLFVFSCLLFHKVFV